jgi:hypothetical protein
MADNVSDFVGRVGEQPWIGLHGSIRRAVLLSAAADWDIGGGDSMDSGVGNCPGELSVLGRLLLWQ